MRMRRQTKRGRCAHEQLRVVVPYRTTDGLDAEPWLACVGCGRIRSWFSLDADRFHDATMWVVPSAEEQLGGVPEQLREGIVSVFGPVLPKERALEAIRTAHEQWIDRRPRQRAHDWRWAEFRERDGVVEFWERAGWLPPAPPERALWGES